MFSNKTPSFCQNIMGRKGAQLCLTLCNPVDCSHPGSSAHGILQLRILTNGMGCHSLLQGSFLIQGSNPGLWHCRLILYHLSHQEAQWKNTFLQIIRVRLNKGDFCCCWFYRISLYILSWHMETCPIFSGLTLSLDKSVF